MRNIKHCGIVLGIGLLSIIWFDYKIIGELFNQNQFRVSGDDALIGQYYAELFRQRILTGIYPFKADTNILYPYGTEVAAADLGLIHGWVFLILRPLMSMHQSFQFMIIVNTLVAYLLMFKTLRILKIAPVVSVLGAIAYTYMPFLGYWQITEHYTYIHHYLFPGLFIWMWKWKCALSFRKYGWSVIVGGWLGLALLINFYYFYMLMLLMFGLIWFKRFDHQWWKEIGLVIMGLVLVGWPMLVGVTTNMQTLRQQRDKSATLTYSSKLSGFLVASPASIYRQNQPNQVLEVWKPGEGTNYLGLYLIVSLPVGIWWWIKTRNKRMGVAIIVSMGCLWLSLGPVIQEVTWWTSTRQVISTHLPSLYAVLSWILPFFDQLRAPVRLIVLGTFFGVIGTCWMWSEVMKLIKDRINRVMFGAILFAVVGIDQLYIIDNKAYRTIDLPMQIYQQIRDDKNSQAVVLELPMALRDGYRIAGGLHSLDFMLGTLIHSHPIMGGYNSRIKDVTFDYYRKCSVTKLALLASNPEAATDYQAVLKNTPLEEWQNAFTDLGIKYAILPTDLNNMDSVEEILKQAGFKRKLSEKNKVLFERESLSLPTRKSSCSY